MRLNYYAKTMWPSATYTQNNVGGSNPGVTSVTKPGITQLEVYSAGARLKDFKKRKAAGELLPFTAYQKWTWESNPGFCSYSWQSKTGTGSYFDGGDTRAFGYDQCKLFLPDEIRRIAKEVPLPNSKKLVQSAAADAYSQGYDLLTAIGEGSKTLEMILGLKGRLKDILRAEAKDIRNVYRLLVAKKNELKQLRKNHQLLLLDHNRGARLSTRDLEYTVRLFEKRERALNRTIRDFGRRIDRYSSGYLEARYGWRPFFNDMMSLSKELNEPTSVEKQVYTNHRKESKDGTIYRQVSKSSAAGTWTQYQEITVFRSMRATVSAEFEASRFRGNVAVTTWELVTLSFVVDWFLSIGKAIEAASLVALASKTQSAVSTLLEVEVRILDTDPVPGSNAKAFNIRRSSSVKFTEVTRSPAGISFVPQWQRKLDKFKVLDLVAIGTQLLRGRLRDMNRYNG